MAPKGDSYAWLSFAKTTAVMIWPCIWRPVVENPVTLAEEHKAKIHPAAMAALRAATKEEDLATSPTAPARRERDFAAL